VNRKRVERLMRQNGVCGICKRRKPRWRTPADTRPVPDDLVRSDFRPGRPDAAWAGDITYIPTGGGWLHLAVVLDVGSRRIIGYSMAPDMAAPLVVDALDTAAASRGHRTAGVATTG
jgi:transposase InsO family protein